MFGARTTSLQMKRQDLSDIVWKGNIWGLDKSSYATQKACGLPICWRLHDKRHQSFFKILNI